jgi:hypothetical protein
MRLQSASYILGAALCLTAPAWAQSTAITPTGTGTQTTSTGTQTTSSTSTGAFQNLSPGGQKIAQSLFDAQHPPTGTKAMTLDQIAALKGKEGWGRAFKEMKSDGLVQARNLGQVVSSHEHSIHSEHAEHAENTTTHTTNTARTGGSRHVSTRTTSSSRTPIVITNGSGRSVTVASNAGRGGMGRGGGGRFASNSSPHVTTGAGMSGNGGGFGGGGHGGGSSHGGGHGGK